MTAVDTARTIARRVAETDVLVRRVVDEVIAETGHLDEIEIEKRLFEHFDEPIAAKVYEATDEVVRKHGAGGDPFTQIEAPNVAAELLASAGFDVPCPPIHLDYEDDDPLAYGQCRADGIHIRKSMAFPIALAHELAHYVTPGDGHGPAFRSAAILLTKAAVSSPAAAMLDAEFAKIQ